MVIVYKVSPTTYWLGKKLIHSLYIGLCNLVAEKLIAVELIQHEATSEAMAREIIRLIQEQDYREEKLQQLKLVKAKLGDGGGSEKAACVALEMLKV